MPNPVVWSIQANGGEGITESYGYRTDVIPAYTNAEQRVHQRSVALEALEFGIAAVEARESQLATSIIFAKQADVLAVPLWQYGSRITADVIATATFLPIGDALVVPYRIPGYAVLWRDAFTYELVTVIARDGTGLTLSAPGLASGWPASTLVFPARSGRLSDRVWVKRDSTRVLTGRVRFTMEQV